MTKCFVSSCNKRAQYTIRARLISDDPVSSRWDDVELCEEHTKMITAPFKNISYSYKITDEDVDEKEQT